MNEIFLGGTCARNRWREEIAIPALLKSGVPQDAIFNPSLGPGMWNKEAQALEDQVKRDCALLVYYIGDPRDGQGVSPFSLVEATMSLYDDPHRTFVVLDPAGTDPHAVKALRKTLQELVHRFPNAHITDDLQELIAFIIDRYGRK